MGFTCCYQSAIDILYLPFNERRIWNLGGILKCDSVSSLRSPGGESATFNQQLIAPERTETQRAQPERAPVGCHHEIMCVFNPSRSPAPLFRHRSLQRGCLSFRARKQGACRELKGPAALVSPPSCQRTSNTGKPREEMKTRQERWKRTRQGGRRHITRGEDKRERNRWGSNVRNEETTQRMEETEKRGVWTKRLKKWGSNSEFIQGQSRIGFVE